MRHKILQLDEMFTSIASYAQWDGGDDNSNNIERLKKYVRLFLTSDLLTERQKMVIDMYYLKNLKLREMSDITGLSPSTLSRHISYALKKMRRYYIELSDYIG